MEYHRDKNDREIRSLDVLIHDNGKEYNLFGTGLAIPPFVDEISVWDENNKLKTVHRSQVRVKGLVDSDAFMITMLLGLIAFIAFGIKTIVNV